MTTLANVAAPARPALRNPALVRPAALCSATTMAVGLPIVIK